MAVEIVYRSSRDPEQLFMDKAEADRHDKMLELAETLGEVLQQAVPDLSEKLAEEECAAWCPFFFPSARCHQNKI